MARRRGSAISASLVAILAFSAVGAQAQVPGLPVLQNAFSNRGLVLAANFGGGSGQSFYGAAGAWGLGTGAISVSAAAGAQGANGATRGAYGGRVAARVWSSGGGGLGVAGFAGLGGAPRTRTGSIVTNPAEMVIPAGLSVGYRRALGAKRGLSAYVAPFYRWARADSGAVVSNSAFTVSGGLDFSLTSSVGVTVGGELGGSKRSSGGNTRSAGAFGAGVSFVPGGRR